MDLLFIVVGLVLLILGGDWLLKSAVGFSLRLQIPKIIIGMTVVSFATSAPELIVSLKSALQGHSDLAMGNVIGSNIANLALVLGITVLLSDIKVTQSFFKTDWPIRMLASSLLYVFIVFDGQLVAYEGAILFGALVAFLVYMLKFQKTAVEDEMPEDDEELPLWKALLFLAVGGVALWGGSELLITGAVGLAEQFNVSQRIIGVSIVSVGTSIPELSASIIAVLKKEKAISLGNLLGSNIFNILAVLGLTAVIHPIEIVDKGLIENDIYWMLGISFLILPLSFFYRKMNFGKPEGGILLLIYIAFIYTMIF
ncbi:MAG: calcium/sodium antiporter [Flavicella sp.]|nr:calcium/sodium antiporter [Flavicella sp.]